MAYKFNKAGIFSVHEIERHAQEAFDKGFYLEAIVLLHNELEFHMRNIVLLNVSGSGKTHEIKWKFIYELSYNKLAKILFIFDFISLELYVDLQSYNKTRNQIVHKLMEFKGKSKSQVKEKTIKENFETGERILDDITKILLNSINVNISKPIKKLQKEIKGKIKKE